MGRKRDLLRTQRLLRKLDLEEVLEDGLDMDILWMNGADAYLECPDPDHDDENPSFHVCVEDVEDAEGRSRIGWFNCWSHPEVDGLRGRNFLDLVAKIRNGLWNDENGEPIWPTDAQRTEAANWLRAEYLRGDARTEEDLQVDALRKRRRAVPDPVEWRELLLPPSDPISDAEPQFLAYLERRGITAERAAELRVRAVRYPGERLRKVLGRTVPGVLFPIPWEGRDVNWFVRGTGRRLSSSDKGRYCPGVPLGKGAGILWAPDGLTPGRAKVLVEGIFDAERVRAIVEGRGLDFQVAAVLGGRLYPAQAKSLRLSPLVIHLADGDDSGKKLGVSIENELSRSSTVLLRNLPAGTDPGDAPEELILEALRPEERVPKVRVRFRHKRRRR